MPVEVNIPSKYSHQSSATKTFLEECSSSPFAVGICGHVFLEGKKELTPEPAPGWNLMTALWEIAVKKLKVPNKSKTACKSYTHLYKGK